MPYSGKQSSISRFRLSLMIVILLILFSVSSCSTPGPEDGELRITFTGLDTVIGSLLHYRIIFSSDTEASCDDDGVICDSFAVSRGSHTFIIRDPAQRGTEPVTAERSIPGGSGLYLVAWIDIDACGGDPVGGLDYEMSAARFAVIDGDVSVTIPFPDEFQLSEEGEAETAIYIGEAQSIGGSLGAVYPGIPFDYAMSVRNRGTAVMFLDTGEPITLSGSEAALFSITGDLEEFSVYPGAGLPFTLTFNAASDGDLSTGLKSVIFSLHYRDPFEVPYQLSFTVDVNLPALTLPATGQTASYASGDDGDLRKGLLWPEPRFTDNGNGTVSDALTGLMWQAVPSGSITTWDYAVETYVNSINSSVLGGHSDWHLPNVNEMCSLINSSVADTAVWLNGMDGFSGISSGRYWLSTRSYYSGYTYPMAYFLDFSDNTLGRSNISAIPYCRVWLVREEGIGSIGLAKTGKTAGFYPDDDGSLELGITWPEPRFFVLESTVFDSLTGLMWSRMPCPAPLTWESALTFAAALETAGYDDWRVPNRVEMRSLVHYGVSSNDSWLSAQFTSELPALKYYWTSTTALTNSAYAVYLNTGTCAPLQKSTLNFVWAVRDVY